MTEDRLYAYTAADFGPDLPPDLFAAAQTEAEVPARLSQHARPVMIAVQGDRLSAPARISGMHFSAGDTIRPLWTLIDQAKSLRLIAMRITANDREDGAVIGACTVLACALPLKPGQSFTLARPVNDTGAATPLMIGFADDSRVLTDQGKRLVQEVAVGNRLWCTDGTYRPVIWRGTQSFPARGIAAPVRLRRGYAGLAADLVLAPLQSVQIETDAGPALAPACAFVDAGLAVREFGVQVTWHHLLLDTHALVLINGLACDTLWAGDMIGTTRPADWPAGLVASEAPALPRLSRHEAAAWLR